MQALEKFLIGGLQTKINFLNDYNTPCHPEILRAIQEAAGRKHAGYGMDDETEEAAHAVRAFIGRSDAEVHFLMGGTQANLIALSAFLRPHEAAICPATAHIAVHETGAVESTGHKVIAVETADGKISPGHVKNILSTHTNEHMVKPRLVFISQPTEYGTLYSLGELRALRNVCGDNGLLLYLDGARLATALESPRNNAPINEIAQIADAFYLGGTKNGLLFGEAMVITNREIGADFRYLMKQKGGMLAKGFLLGLQFRRALESGLYWEIAAQSNAMAARIYEGLKALGCEFAVETFTNQVFPIISKESADALKEGFLFETWGPVGENNVCIRLVATWETTAEEVDALLEAYKKILS